MRRLPLGYPFFRYYLDPGVPNPKKVQCFVKHSEKSKIRQAPFTGPEGNIQKKGAP